MLFSPQLPPRRSWRRRCRPSRLCQVRDIVFFSFLLRSRNDWYHAVRPLLIETYRNSSASSPGGQWALLRSRRSSRSSWGVDIAVSVFVIFKRMISSYFVTHAKNTMKYCSQCKALARTAACSHPTSAGAAPAAAGGAARPAGWFLIF